MSQAPIGNPEFDSELLTGMDTLAFQVFRIDSILQENSEWLVKDLGLTHARVRILFSMHKAQPELRSISDIARDIGLSRQAVQRLTTQMLKEGILEEQTNPLQNKSRFFTISQYGQQLVSESRRRRSILVNHALGEEVLEQLKTASQFLQVLEDALESHSSNKVRQQLDQLIQRKSIAAITDLTSTSQP